MALRALFALLLTASGSFSLCKGARGARSRPSPPLPAAQLDETQYEQYTPDNEVDGDSSWPAVDDSGADPAVEEFADASPYDGSAPVLDVAGSEEEVYTAPVELAPAEASSIPPRDSQSSLYAPVSVPFDASAASISAEPEPVAAIGGSRILTLPAADAGVPVQAAPVADGSDPPAAPAWGEEDAEEVWEPAPEEEELNEAELASADGTPIPDAPAQAPEATPDAPADAQEAAPSDESSSSGAGAKKGFFFSNLFGAFAGKPTDASAPAATVALPTAPVEVATPSSPADAFVPNGSTALQPSAADPGRAAPAAEAAGAVPSAVPDVDAIGGGSGAPPAIVRATASTAGQGRPVRGRLPMKAGPGQPGSRPGAPPAARAPAAAPLASASPSTPAAAVASVGARKPPAAPAPPAAVSASAAPVEEESTPEGGDIEEKAALVSARRPQPLEATAEAMGAPAAVPSEPSVQGGTFPDAQAQARGEDESAGSTTDLGKSENALSATPLQLQEGGVEGEDAGAGEGEGEGVPAAAAATMFASVPLPSVPLPSAPSPPTSLPHLTVPSDALSDVSELSMSPDGTVNIIPAPFGRGQSGGIIEQRAFVSAGPAPDRGASELHPPTPKVGGRQDGPPPGSGRPAAPTAAPAHRPANQTRPSVPGKNGTAANPCAAWISKVRSLEARLAAVPRPTEGICDCAHGASDPSSGTAGFVASFAFASVTAVGEALEKVWQHEVLPAVGPAGAAALEAASAATVRALAAAARALSPPLLRYVATPLAILLSGAFARFLEQRATILDWAAQGEGGRPWAVPALDGSLAAAALLVGLALTVLIWPLLEGAVRVLTCSLCCRRAPAGRGSAASPAKAPPACAAAASRPPAAIPPASFASSGGVTRVAVGTKLNGALPPLPPHIAEMLLRAGVSGPASAAKPAAARPAVFSTPTHGGSAPEGPPTPFERRLSAADEPAAAVGGGGGMPMPLFGPPAGMQAKARPGGVGKARTSQPVQPLHSEPPATTGAGGAGGLPGPSAPWLSGAADASNPASVSPPASPRATINAARGAPPTAFAAPPKAFTSPQPPRAAVVQSTAMAWAPPARPA
jgi:hypothetical protein